VLLKYCVPLAGVGFAGWVATVVHAQPVICAAGLFVVVSALARYWAPHILGETPSLDAQVRFGGASVFWGVASIAVAVGIIFAVRRFIAEPYQVMSSSMVPTLEPADQIAANKLAYRGRPVPSRGDVVVFRSAAVALPQVSVPDELVKRVIGLPGDTIEMSDGAPVINGWQVPTCLAGTFVYVMPDGEGNTLRGKAYVEFLGHEAYLTVHSVDMPTLAAPYIVPEGEVFVLGDNRVNSLDSRSWNNGHGGGVPRAAIEGRAQWFLVGTHRSGEADFGRFGRPIDALQGHLHMEGLNADALASGIALCLRNPPAVTLPPRIGQP
jgi:signal peptidase I